MTPRARRHFARTVLAGLLVLHLGAVALYLLNERQFSFLGLWREGRQDWREGRLDLAATKLRAFADGYREATRPFLMRRDFPRESQAWSALGMAERQRGRRRDALNAFLRARNLGDATAWRERRQLLWEAGDAAGLELQARERLATGHPEAWQELADARRLRNDYPGAVDALESGLRALPAWLRQQRRPLRAADGGVVDEELSLELQAGTVAWLAGDALRGSLHCERLARGQDAENPADGLCRAAAALAAGQAAAAVNFLLTTPLAAGEQQSLAEEIRRRANPGAPVRQSASPSPAPAVHPRR
jgi:tetratricopeptide (TPR) repeat protein